MLNFLLFFVGLAILLLGSRGVVGNALVISGHLRIPPLIIGMTIVAIGTSLPEIFISGVGAVEKATDLAIGNIVGSNIANIGLIFGLILTLHHLYIGGIKTQQNMFLYLIISVIFLLVLFFSQLKVFVGLIFLIAGFLVLYWQMIGGKKGASGEDKNVLERLSRIKGSPVSAGFLFILSLAALFIGSKLLVDSGVKIAQFLGVSQVIIGVTAVAVGTSIPELAVSIVGLVTHEEKLVVGNILGSNIFNILFGAGILGLTGVANLRDPVSLMALLIFSAFFCLLIFAFKGKTVPRLFGPVFLVLYGLYLGTLLVL